ncbi:DNA cytosine methyltransferase [Gracilibacillus alcaliphilus]|uniref:DNA cytosine methyltransferase n=1 Tax=Gracilibacillus alcaliphilus TaxID=1401441 RepID=UPI001958E9D0|nr:DNA (cytosine-5-)-methyltransferase [Gracilibacillus alcaliphilus]MBM7676104.1 DNA (cytosine-5)-methyltransferase 1 [Gracilibacillus alcaliphilus]
MIRLGTVFSGIGAIEHALERLNIKHSIEFACDNGERNLKTSEEEILTEIKDMNDEEIKNYIEKLYMEECGVNYVEQTYKANYKVENDRFYQDVRFLNGYNFTGKVDLFVGGSPCQSFSHAGKRGGLDDARGTLFYDFARLVYEIQPKVFIYENVPGMLNHDEGNTWKVISKIFDESNYEWTYWILNAKHYGLPQNRRRIFVIGYHEKYKKHFQKLTKPDEIPLNINMEEYLERSVDNKYYLPEKGFLRVINPKHKRHVAVNGSVARCQVANQQFNWYGDMRIETDIPERVLRDERIYKGIYNGELSVARGLTPRECFRLMGFSDEFVIPENINDKFLYRQSGNSIAVNVLMEIMYTILETGIFDNGD